MNCVFTFAVKLIKIPFSRLKIQSHIGQYRLELFSLFIIVVGSQTLQAQSYYTPLSNSLLNSFEDSLHHIDNETFTSVKPFSVGIVNTLADNFAEKLKKEDHFARDKWLGRKIFNEDLISKYTEDFGIRINPLFHLTLGKDNLSEKKTYLNTRGFQADGRIGKKFFFYSEFLENQAYFPKYQRDWILENKVVPSQGTYKLLENGGLDFFSVRGHIEYQPSKYFSFRYGYGQNFIGDGYRSLLLSDNSFNYPYLRITTSFWKLQYTNIFTQMQDIRYTTPGNGVYIRKYTTSHLLSANISKRLNVGIFETVVYGDSAGTRGYDINYLNPVIFYRPIENAIGSAIGNVLLGLNVKYKLTNNLHLYSQLILDEFNSKEIQKRTGWWANKYGYQIGFKSFSTFIPNFTVQSEFNWVRPFTYSHGDVFQNYAHYNQPLAHPLGSNFKEFLTWLSYRKNRIIGELQIRYAKQGRDTSNSNWGTDVYKSYDSRAQDYNNKVGQGVATSTFYIDAKIAYLVNPRTNLRFELGITNRRYKTALEKEDLKNESTQYVYLGLHSDIANRYFDF